MKYDTLQVTQTADTVTITLDRPEVHNAMNERLMKELILCFKKLNADRNIRVIVLTGNGRSFCAGADLNWMKSMAGFSREENIRDSRMLLDLYETIYSSPKPVIGRINGHAFGGGLGLVAVCDINIAIPDLKFAFSEVKLGIIPAVISTYVVRRIGTANMRRLFITGERFNSSYAKEIGLIDHVIPEDQLDSKVNEYIDLIRSSGPKAIQEIKKLVDMYLRMDAERYKDFTVEKIAELRVSNEGQEGINAFLDKRKPRWNLI
ncbi:MAG: enoyl-CoA hydratase [Thermoplasmata archaeon]|nr:MAG: enoyl-CoA hydratase [Thermoplasmata archaeon]